MLATTATITINAAFLQEIKQDNQHLRSLFAEADRFCLEGKFRTVSPHRLACLLGELRDQLGMHFALEEAYGYFDEPLDVDLCFGHKCELLRQQHVTLFLEACRLAELAERVAYHEASARQLTRILLRLRAFHDQCRAHEQREIELIYQALDVEIGVGD